MVNVDLSTKVINWELLPITMTDFTKKPQLSDDALIIDGNYHPIKDWEMDKEGYLLIRVNKELNKIEVGFCESNNIITILVRGNKPQDIYFEITKRNLLDRPEHYAYLGKELEKAYLALKYNLEYVQDDELDIK
jgi:hypothetical protein